MAVRRESVEIQVSSNLAAVAARDAAAVKLLADTLDSVSKAGVQSDRTNKRISDSLGRVDKGAKRADLSINQLTGRLRVAADVAAILGPALAPVGAMAIPAVVGLTTALTFGAAAAGTALLAFNGMGDAIGAMNDYALEPSTANAEKLEASLAKLSPEAIRFARELGNMRSEFAATRDAAAEGLFPELTPALDDLDGLLERVQPVLREVGAATGEMLADGLDSLDSERWQDFFDYLESDARPILSDLGATAGGFAHGLSEVVMAFGPLNRDFSGWLRGLGEGFSNWAEGLDQTQGFTDFITYIRQNGPQVAETAGALGRALVAITTAAAPLGGPVLAGIEAFANAISAIANSDIGTPIFTALAAMALFNRAMALGRASATAFAATRANFAALGASLDTVGTSAGRSASGVGRLARTAGGLAAVAGGLTMIGNAIADGRGMSVDTENLQRNLEALANRTDVDSADQLLSQIDESMTHVDSLQAKIADFAVWEPLSGFGLFGDTSLDISENNLTAIDQALAGLVESGNAEQAADAFQRIMEASSGMAEGTSFSEDFRNQMLESFTGYGIALENAEAANDGYASSTDGAGEAAGRAALNVNELAQAMRTQASEALAAFDAQTAWGQAVADARKQARQGKDGIDEMTQAGRNNRTALSGLAGAWNSQSREVKNNVAEYREARRTFLQVANAMGIGKREARQLADELLEMPRKLLIGVEFRGFRRGLQDALDLGAALGDLNNYTATPRVIAETARAGAALGGIIGIADTVDRRRPRPVITADAVGANRTMGQVGTALSVLTRRTANPTLTARDNASPVIAGVQAGLAGIRSKTVTVTVLGVRAGVDVGGALGAGKAYGGPIVGPGSDRSDNILTPTSPQEWVIQAPSARYYGPALMNAINNRQIDRAALERQGVQNAMRSGGTQRVMVQSKVSGYLTTSSGERVSLQEIESLIDQRIEEYAEADDDYSRSMAKRVPA